MEVVPTIFPNVNDQLNEVVDIKQKDQLLKHMAEAHPHLRIVVVDLENPLFKSEPAIAWRDVRVSPIQAQQYQQYMKSQIQSVAFHISPTKEIKRMPKRPLIEFSVIATKKNVPRHALLHEYLHLLQDKIQPTNKLKIDDDKTFKSALHSAEEVWVDLVLLEKSQELKFKTEGLCQRHRYLKNNLQVLKSQLSDIHESSLSQNDKKVIKALSSLASKAKVVELKNHTTCFLHSFKGS